MILVITIIVLVILSTTVIISLSNTKIINEASLAVFKNDMTAFKDVYEMYIVDKKIENSRFKKEKLNLTYLSNPEEFIKIFGNNVPEKYIYGLEIKKGQLVYNTEDQQLLEILNELDMIKPLEPIITLNKNQVEISIEDGKTAIYQLTAILTNAEGILEWSSSNTEVADVNNDGLVTAKSVGTAIITVKYNDITATCKVTVAKKLPEIIDISNIQIGDLVEYKPSSNSTTEYIGSTYIKDTDKNSDTYNTYIETTAKYKPGTMSWVYLGTDENNNILLTSQEATSFSITIAGQDGFVTGPNRMDELCNTLYGNTAYGTARNMKIEDVNKVLGYDGAKGMYKDLNGKDVWTDVAMTIGEIESLQADTLDYRLTPRLSNIPFNDFLALFTYYRGTAYKEDTTEEYKLIFNKPDGTTQSTYWLSSASISVLTHKEYVGYGAYRVRCSSNEVSVYSVFLSHGYEDSHEYALRPVIVLNTNIKFSEKNSSGEWTLIAI